LAPKGIQQVQILSVIHILSGKRIKWFTDNQNVVSIVSKGSTKSVLQELALDILNIGGTNKPLAPCQSTVKASMPVEYTFQNLE
jgi:hypothetical protein